MKRGISRHQGRADKSGVNRDVASPKSGAAMTELERQLMLAEALIPDSNENYLFEQEPLASADEDSLAVLNEQLTKAEKLMHGGAASPVLAPTPPPSQAVPSDGDSLP